MGSRKRLEPTSFQKETPFERLANRTFGALVRLGLGSGHNYLLEVRGRKSGKIYSTPVNLLEYHGRRYLVASRGETQWARNARSAECVWLRKGLRRMEFQAHEVPVKDRPPILKEFLDRFATSVQRFHAVAAGSPPEAHLPDAAHHPVFELIEAARRSQ